MQWLLRTVAFLLLLGHPWCFLQKEPTNPEAHMNVSEMISFWGYTSEEHEVVTKDGYILPVYRIPHGKNESSNSAPKPIVYLQHGWTLSASIWIANLPNNSLGFLLADAGYDVWMGNSRGNVWARKHLYLDTDSKEFWAFSYDEMIKYDLPATIDFILKKTGQKQMYYVGHSQGTIMAFGAFSTNPELAQKIRKNFLLAPIATVRYITSAIRILSYTPPSVFKMLFGEKDFLSIDNSTHIRQYICQHQTIGTACNNLFTLLFGYNPKNLNESRLDVYLGQFPAGTSIQTVLHYGQAVHSGRFQAYDWGSPFLNIQHYNQPTPPLYKVEDMKVPTAMWSGGQDSLSDLIDVAILEPQITNLIYHKKISDYTHMDFVIGLNARNEVFNEILNFISEDQSG